MKDDGNYVYATQYSIKTIQIWTKLYAGWN